MRRLTPLLALLVAFPGCARRQRPSSTYVYLAGSDIDSLDPDWAYDRLSDAAILQMYEPLLAFKPGSAAELEPLISEKVPSRANGLISADGLTYRFPIRKGVKFHGGQTLTPEDVRYSLLRFLLTDRDAGPSFVLLEPLLGYASTREGGKPKPAAFDDAAKAVRVEGDSVVLTLKRPFAPLLTVLATWAPMLSKDWCAKSGEWDGTRETWARFNNPAKESSFLFANANGTGPFLLERRSPEAKEVVLRRFDGYWRGPAKLSRALIKAVDEFATRKLMLQAGDADAIRAERLQLPLLQDLDGVQIVDGLSLVETRPAVFFTFRIETAGNPSVGSGKLDGKGIPADFFADKDVRRGFAHAFDYEGYIRDVDRGKGTRAVGFIPRGLLGHNDGKPRRGYDMAKAAKHLKRAWGGALWEKGFRFTASYEAGDQPGEAVANMLKRSLESLNPRFRVDVRPIQWSTYLDQQSHGKLPLFVTGWTADYPDPHNFAFSFMHSQGNMPSTQRYRNPEADRLVAAAAQELDEAKRAALYQRLQAIYEEDVPSFTILNSVYYRTQRTWVKGFVHYPMWLDAPYSCPLYALEKSDS
ncbi:MAG TPA: ABC transporter substrate-binding protein [Elusimicrobiota bacterium]|nr:ABC transporter substrate-binding protein [Elusimicrobiota bacterium]